MGIFKTYFEFHSISLLVSGLMILLLCLILSVKIKNKASLLLLLIGSAILFTFAATLDPFLNLWDERFHALVAKNFLQHPLIPTLYDNPVVSMDYDRWDRYHIWFHKQPLFLWQIALSYKVFGISEFTLRIPNIIMGTILTFVIYKSGQRLFTHRVGIIAGILFCTSNYMLELVSGRYGLDHNDFSFLFYISLSIWSFIEYNYTKEKKWIVAIGLFSGLAILCKWVVGLLVYFGWIVMRLISREISLKKNMDIIIALCITLIVALPWQLYEFICFPTEAMMEYNFYADHFNKPLDGHSGPWYYHFNIIPKIYGLVGAICLIPALVYFKIRLNNKKLFWYFISNILVVYVFFSFAQTRMPSFTLILFLIIALVLASFYDYLFSKISSGKPGLNNLIFLFGMLGIVFFNLKVEKIQAHHTSWKNNYPDREQLINNKRIFQNLTLDPNSVLFNIKGRHYIECMFYTGQPCYNFIPSQTQYSELKETKYQIVVFGPNLDKIPTYLKDDESVLIVEELIQGYE